MTVLAIHLPDDFPSGGYFSIGQRSEAAEAAVSFQEQNVSDGQEGEDSEV
jgi:hypothetical protein